MKSDVRVAAEIKAVVDVWNNSDDHDPHSIDNQMASAIYHTLRWARGCREGSPADWLRNWLQRRKAAGK